MIFPHVIVPVCVEHVFPDGCVPAIDDNFALICPEFLIVTAHVHLSPGFDSVVSPIVTDPAAIVAVPQLLPVADVPPAVADTDVEVVSKPTFHVNEF